MKITVKNKFDLSIENLDDILVTAFEGGINYWCNRVEIIKGKGAYASDIVANGGTVRLYDMESDESWELSRRSLVRGVQIFCNENGIMSADDLMEVMDADVADVIVQLAIFEEVVFS